MVDYQKLYTTLFNRITDAIDQLEKSNYGAARDILIQAQQETEELYLEATERRRGKRKK